MYQFSMLPPPAELGRLLETLGRGTPADAFESQTLEFKRPSASMKATLATLADAAVCFANADGGTIVLGVDDKATTRTGALLGVGPSYTIDVIRRGIFDRTSPPITATAAEYLENGIRLVIIEVVAGLAPHSNTAGTATRRLGTECRPYTPEQQREVLTARGQLDWSAEGSGLPIAERSATDLARVRDLLRLAGKEHLAALGDRSLLGALRLDAGDGTLTNAGVLLLAPENQVPEFVPAHGYSYQYRPSPGSESTFRLRGHQPFVSALQTLLDAVEARQEIRPLALAGGAQLTLIDFPPDAVREVVVNALLHRSYETRGSVDIDHSPERLSISSPGGLVAGVTPGNILTHPSTPRHRLLAEVVSLLQLGERTGQGIDRAYREMLRAGKAPPAIEDAGVSVRAVLEGGIGNDAFVRFVGQLPEELGRDVEVLITLSTLRGSTSIDAHRLGGAIQRSAVEAQGVLSRLADDRYALLEPTRRTARRSFPAYRLRSAPLAALSRAVAYRRRVPDEIDAKVVEHVREYGFVTNRTLQRMFDIHLYAARNMLTDLRNRGIVTKLDDARGGPGVRYGAGPNFPSRRGDLSRTDEELIIRLR